MRKVLVLAALVLGGALASLTGGATRADGVICDQCSGGGGVQPPYTCGNSNEGQLITWNGNKWYCYGSWILVG